MLVTVDKMYKGAVLFLVIVSFAVANGKIFNFEKFTNYTRSFGFSEDERSNELWHGIIKDCSKKVTFSCIQKNAYTYLDRTFIDRDNITVFDGLRLTRNDLDYDDCGKNDPKSNLVEDADGSRQGRKINADSDENKLEEDGKDEKVVEEPEEDGEEEEEELSPLEEVTHALRKKTMKFLATRDYEIQLPGFIGAGSSLKISPREIDENGALIRIDFGNQVMEDRRQHARLFLKKISEHQFSEVPLQL